MGGPREDEIAEWDDGVPTDMDSIAYSIAANHEHEYVDTRADDNEMRVFDLLNEDVAWAKERFNEVIEWLGIDPIAVEQYLVHEDYYYGGQCDLLYEDANGNTVLADLKTSSGLREKHVLQAIAYKRMVEDGTISLEHDSTENDTSETGRDCTEVPIDTIDRCEIIRLNADKQDVMVHGSDYPDHVDRDDDRYEAATFYSDYYGDYTYSNDSEIWAQFRDLLKQCHSDVQFVEDFDIEVNVDG
jgi:hypothetical protein